MNELYSRYTKKFRNYLRKDIRCKNKRLMSYIKSSPLKLSYRWNKLKHKFLSWRRRWNGKLLNITESMSNNNRGICIGFWTRLDQRGFEGELKNSLF